MATPPSKQLLGWREWLALPDLGVSRIKAKIDTGARTSALHAEDIRIIRRRGGERVVKFTVLPDQRSHDGAHEVEAPFVGYRKIRSSNGRVENRPVIATTADVGGVLWDIEITLTRRSLMGFRMLLGRQALRTRARIDPARSFVTRRERVGKKSRRAKAAKGRG